MTATAVQVSQQAGISEKEWVRLFPKEVTENYTSSMTFIKQLTVVAVSTITYLKNAFPEESYFSETFGGLKLKILKEKCQDELAQFMSTSMRQAFDAFDKKYVHQLALCFYRGECSADNLIEYHVFEYAYSDSGATVTVSGPGRGAAGAGSRRALRCSLDAVRARTAMLVRALSLFVWQNCTQDLPQDYDVSLRLYYTEDSPAEYQAPGFAPSPEPDHLAAAAGAALCLGRVETPFHKVVARSFVRDLYDSEAAAVSALSLPTHKYQAPGFAPSPEPDHLAAAAGAALCLGRVETPFHKVVARSFVRDLYDSEAAAPSDNVPEISQDGSDDFQGWARSSQSPEAEHEHEYEPEHEHEYEPEHEHEHEPEHEHQPRVRCPCAVTNLDLALVTCQYCGTQQHAACFGLLAPVAEHCCAACASQEPGRSPTCAVLAGLDTRRQECLCVFRLVLVLCCGQATLAGAELAARLRLPAAAAGKMLRLLHSHRVLDADSHPHDLTVPRKINSIRLKLAMKRFFPAEEEGAEEAPANAEPAPAAAEPAPAAAEPAPAAADVTLQQYRAAVAEPAPPAPRGRTLKRKPDEDEHPDPTKLPKLRSGTKTKKRV